MKLKDMFDGQAPTCLTDDPAKEKDKIPLSQYMAFQAMAATLSLESVMPNQVLQQNRHPAIVLFRTVDMKGNYVTLLMVSLPGKEPGSRSYSPLGILSDDPNALLNEHVGPQDGSKMISLRGEIVTGSKPFSEEPSFEELGNIFAGKPSKYTH